MPPIRKGDGTGLAPKGFAEVRKGDGTVLWAASSGGIPDSGDLQAAYDLSKNNGSLPISDQSGNGHDLNTGQFSGVNVSINGVQAGEYDGVDDVTGTTFSTVSQPFTIVVAFEAISPDNTIFDRIVGGSNSDEGDIYLDNDNTYLSVSAGTDDIESTTSIQAGDVVVASTVVRGSNSILRANQTEIASGALNADLNGMALGAAEISSPFDFANVKIGEVLVYPLDKESNISSIEQYLIDKWGPTTSL